MSHIYQAICSISLLMNMKRMTKNYIITWKTNMAGEIISPEFRLKTIDETNYFIEEIKHNTLMIKKHKK